MNEILSTFEQTEDPDESYDKIFWLPFDGKPYTLDNGYTYQQLSPFNFPEHYALIPEKWRKKVQSVLILDEPMHKRYYELYSIGKQYVTLMDLPGNQVVQAFLPASNLILRKQDLPYMLIHIDGGNIQNIWSTEGMNVRIIDTDDQAEDPVRIIPTDAYNSYNLDSIDEIENEIKKQHR